MKNNSTLHSKLMRGFKAESGKFIQENEFDDEGKSEWERRSKKIR